MVNDQSIVCCDYSDYKMEELRKFERKESIANGGTRKFRKKNTHLQPKKKKRK